MIAPRIYYEDELATIYCGDCRDVFPQLEQVPLVLTDPPYAIGGARSEWKVTASVGTGIHMAAQKVKKDGAMFCFTTSSGRGIEFTLGAVGNALRFNRLLAMHKEFVRSRAAGPWRWDLVCILAFGRASFGRPEYSSLFKTTGPAHLDSQDSGHPAELPLGIGRWLWQPFKESADVVLDPFMGSGSLLIPAYREGTRVIGIEMDEAHCAKAVLRLQQEVMAVA